MRYHSRTERNLEPAAGRWRKQRSFFSLRSMHPWSSSNRHSRSRRKTVMTWDGESRRSKDLEENSPIVDRETFSTSDESQPGNGIFSHVRRAFGRAGPPVTGAWGALKVGVGVGIVTAGHFVVGGAVVGYGIGAIVAAYLWRLSQQPSAADQGDASSYTTESTTDEITCHTTSQDDISDLSELTALGAF
eukprot:Gregarina_sp_Poly_1__1729@NODE_1446_length_4130_cov_51_014029_g958_i0_p3_GENE_NODE_1446_length_4130_cov_51_014029_g958_i0NODE_1446_length_4130_cov_51_014029_g958_i0_p3_ORF_typecomplete_len189_score12_93DUF2523/PF10734_9/5_2DUF2523/PF10734_9/39DUF3482/PF11981_8/0_59_NODE_1446_length_4130_cov_51_014029_g958_i06121178